MLAKPKMPGSQKLADFLFNLQTADLPEKGLTLLKLCLLDTVGCALGGRATEPGAVIDRMLRKWSNNSKCIVIGSPVGAGPEMAAMANGVLAHALIFDDLHRHAKLHPGVATIPAAWAVADLAGASGSTFLAALAAGYETAARVGVAIGMASHRKQGWRATGTVGSFGAAAAAARTFRLNADEFHHAIAIASAQASGNWAFQESAGMELYLAAGTAARNGTVSAMLAQAGMRGAADPLTAKDGGFLGLASDETDPEQIAEGLGSHYRFLDTCIKMYPTCHSSQTGIDAAINLRHRHSVKLDAIERVVVRAGEITRLQCGWNYEPAPPPKLIFHMGYAMALAIKNGEVRPSDFEGERPYDPELTRVARATEVIADPELTAIYAERKPSDVTIYLRDGSMLHERVEYCRGEPENPPTPEVVLKKFKTVGSVYGKPELMDEIADRILHVEREPNLSQLGKLLSQS
jgi:2-methylcitrate dehydratase PrpD